MIKITLITNAGREKIIVPKNSTVRSCLQENSINLQVCAPSLNACTLRPAELDQTFDQLGADDGSVLSCIVKTDNAVQAKIVGNAVVVESNMKLDELKLIAKYRPKAMIMYDEEDGNKTAVFRVMVGDDNNGTMSNAGVCFSNRTTADGNATVTMQLPCTHDASKETVEETIGGALLALAKMEEGYAAIIDGIKEEQAKIREHITIV